MFRAAAVTAGLLGLVLAVPAQDVDYRLRSNRYEGLRDLQTAGETGLRLLSFVAYREPVDLARRPVLRLRFFVPEAQPVFVTAVELQRHGRSHYQMRPTQTRWNAGWQEFAPWPTADVLAPLQIPPDSLGVVARLGQDQEGSGSIAPVVLYTGQYPSDAVHYVVHFLPRNTLSKVEYSVANLDARRLLTRARLCREDAEAAATPCAAANVPFAVTIDLAGQPAGNYRLSINTREHGRTNGPSHQYFFRNEGLR